MPQESSPLVSVIMPVYNGAAYLAEAIESVLRQRYANFELIIIDDCSSDESVKIITSFEDERIVLLTLHHNVGSGGAAHAGFEVARGTYIARMDCDDVMHADKLAKQVAFMQTHPEYGVCGTHYGLIATSSGGKRRRVIIPVHNDVLKFRLLLMFPFCNPTTMYRTSLLRDHEISYNPSLRFAEDLDLIIQLSHHTSFYNLPDDLFDFRKHPQSVTAHAATANNSTKRTVMETYHQHVLSTDITMSEEYRYVVAAYLDQQWHEMQKSMRSFAKGLRHIAASYIHTTRCSASLIYGDAAELLWRALIFKMKGYKKPLTLLQIACSANGLLIYLPGHLWRTYRVHREAAL